MNEKQLPLNRLPIGLRGMVMDISATESEKRRFFDLGLVRGAVVEALHKSPSGDPIAYYIMGAVIALRNQDAEKVLIQSRI